MTASPPPASSRGTHAPAAWAGNATPYVTLGAGIFSFLLFLICAFITGALATRQIREDLATRARWWKAKSILPGALCVSFVCRALWVLVLGVVDRADPPNIFGKLINRFCLLVYCTGYGFVVAHVADMTKVQRSRFLQTDVMTTTWYAFWCGCSVLWAIDVLLTIVWVADDAKAVYDAGLYYLGLLFLVLSILFLTFSLRLHAQLTARVQQRRHVGSTTLVVASICSAFLFLMRFILFVWQPITGNYVKGGGVLYPYFFYEVPEIIPSVLILYAVHRIGQANRHYERFDSGSTASTDRQYGNQYVAPRLSHDRDPPSGAADRQGSQPGLQLSDSLGVTVQQQQVLGRGGHARHFSHDVDTDGAAYDQYDQPYRAATTHGAGVGSLGAAGGVSPGEMMNPAMLLHAARMRGGHASYDGAGSYSDNDHYMSPRDAGMYGVGGVEGSSVRSADYTQM